MKILKFILWPLLLVSLLWVSAIFFGPSVINMATSYLSEGRVKLSRVEVSPKLKINLAVVDFVLPSMAGEKNLVGASRAVSFDWKIKGGFELVGKIGPSSLKDHGSIKSSRFTLEPTSLFDWKEVKFRLKFEELGGTNFDVERGILSGKFTRSFQGLDDVELVLPKASVRVGNVSVKVAELGILIDYFTVGELISQQNLDIKYSIEELTMSGDVLKGSSIYGGIKLLKRGSVFEFSASDVQLGENNLKAKSLSITSQRPLTAGAFEGAWEFAISDIYSKNPAVNIKNYSGDFVVSSSEILHNGRAVLSNLELKTDQYLLGQIKNGILDVGLTGLISSSGIDVKGRGDLTLKGFDDFDASVSINYLTPDFDIFRCIMQKCQVDALEASYNINASGFSLNGDLKCKKADCFNRPRFHKLQTNNTNEFFQALSKTGILSPLVFPIAYFSISSGEIVGDGHVLNF